jgi:hypothetical protein
MRGLIVKIVECFANSQARQPAKRFFICMPRQPATKNNPALDIIILTETIFYEFSTT